jgi:acetyl-CoA C-acetyltransferase
LREVVIVDAVRSPIGRKNGALSHSHSVDVLAGLQKSLFSRTGVDPAEVGQAIGGCVSQVGMQAMNVTRNAWLTAGLPITVAAATVDAQCGSAQHATNLAYSLIASGIVDVAVSSGIELMSRLPMGANVPKDPDVGKPINRSYWAQHEFTTQFEAAERMADKWKISRLDAEQFAKLSQDRAARAWAEGRFDSQIVPVQVPVVSPEGERSGETTLFSRDEAMRETTLDGLAQLRPTGRPDGVHTAGTSSQIADGAAAVLLMTSEKAEQLGVTPMATIVDVCLVGCDPVLMLEGPIPATEKLLSENGLTIDDINLIEINEAFASVVLAFEAELKADRARINPNGGAIALGHPLGATGAMLVTKAAHELQRTGGEYALVTMCCGGGLGTGTLIRRR